MRRLVLWDIDGTLLFGGGVGGRAIAAAAAALADLPITADMVHMHGKTDQQIIRELFLAAAVAEDDIVELLPRAAAEAERQLARHEAEFRASGRVLEGVVDVLAELDGIPGVRQTLLTGNLVANAAIKLAAFDLTGWFDFEVGSYGSDHEDRLQLVPIALERVLRMRGEHYAPDEVWVIGDTPNDLACAKAAGVRCLLVATGGFTTQELSALGPDATMDDLADTDGVVELLTAS